MKIGIFLSIITAALVLEGTGIRYSRELAFSTLILLSIYCLFVVIKNHYHIPNKLGLLYLTFLILTCFSTIISKDIYRSIGYLFLYFSLGIVFIYGYNNKKSLTQYLVPIIFSLSLFFSVYSIIVNNLNFKFWLIEPISGYQLVFPFFSSHNNLGDFLTLPLICLFYYLLIDHKHIFIKISCALLILPFFLFSYSRSAYVSFIVSAGLMLAYFTNKKFKLLTSSQILILLFMALSTLFLFSVASDKMQMKQLIIFNNILMNRNGLSSTKSLSGERLSYTKDALLSLQSYPLLGVGPNNFIYISKQYMTKPWLWSETSHNIFLDILSENGIPAGILFILILFYIFWNSEKNIFFFLAITLLINFQTNYTFKIYSLIFLFVIFLSLLYVDKSKSANADNKVNK